MNLALVTDSDGFAGTERHMLDLAVEMRSLGANPMLICPGAGALAERGRAEDLRVLGLEKRGVIDLRAVGQLARWWSGGPQRSHVFPRGAGPDDDPPRFARQYTTLLDSRTNRAARSVAHRR